MNPTEIDHHAEAFLIEQLLRSDARVLRQISKALQDMTEYSPASRSATPIIVPRDDGTFGIHMHRAGRVMPREWPIAMPTFESIAERLIQLREHDRHIKPRR